LYLVPSGFAGLFSLASKATCDALRRAGRFVVVITTKSPCWHKEALCFVYFSARLPRARSCIPIAMPKVDAGPLSLDSTGLHVKPQMKVAAECRFAKVEFGVDDLRNGLRFAAKAELRVIAESEGYNKDELHANIKSTTPGFKQALELVKKILAKKGEVPEGDEVEPHAERLAASVGMSTDDLDKVLSGHVSKHKMHLKVQADLSAGGSVDARLGWCNTEGYHMVGLGAGAAIGADFSFKLFAGKHKTGKSMKVIIGLSNFTFEYTFPLKDGVAIEGEDTQKPKGFCRCM